MLQRHAWVLLLGFCTVWYSRPTYNTAQTASSRTLRIVCPLLSQAGMVIARMANHVALGTFPSSSRADQIRRACKVARWAALSRALWRRHGAGAAYGLGLRYRRPLIGLAVGGLSAGSGGHNARNGLHHGGS